VGSLNQIAQRFEKAASFVFVYLAEAHASDEWPINQLDNEIPRHQTIGDRRAAAESLVRAFPLHQAFEVVLDTMEDAFNHEFASWPFRFWIIVDGRVALKPLPQASTYDVNELGRWLETYVSTRSSQ